LIFIVGLIGGAKYEDTGIVSTLVPKIKGKLNKGICTLNFRNGSPDRTTALTPSIQLTRFATSGWHSTITLAPVFLIRAT
jgi:hypothetical protein